MITCTSCKHLTNTDEDGMILTCRLSGASCFINDLPFTTLPGCPRLEVAMAGGTAGYYYAQLESWEQKAYGGEYGADWLETVGESVKYYAYEC